MTLYPVLADIAAPDPSDFVVDVVEEESFPILPVLFGIVLLVAVVVILIVAIVKKHSAKPSDPAIASSRSENDHTK